MGDGRGAYGLWVGKPEGNEPLGRPRCRCEDKIKMYLQEEELEGMDWIVPDQNSDRHL
jgi:hypothetical protein